MSKINKISLFKFEGKGNSVLNFNGDLSVATEEQIYNSFEYFHSNTISSKDNETLVSLVFQKEEDEVMFLPSTENISQDSVANINKFINGEEVEVHKLSNGQYSFSDKSSNQIDSEYIYNEIISKIPKKLTFSKLEKIKDEDEGIIFTTEKTGKDLIKLLNSIAIGKLSLNKNSLIINDKIDHPLISKGELNNIIIPSSLENKVKDNGIINSLLEEEIIVYSKFEDTTDLIPNSIILVDKTFDKIDIDILRKINIELIEVDENDFSTLEREINILKKVNELFGNKEIDNKIEIFELKQTNEFLKEKITALETSTKKLSKEKEEYIRIIKAAEDQVDNLENRLSNCGDSAEMEDIKKLLILALKLIDSKEETTNDIFKKLLNSIGNDIKK